MNYNKLLQLIAFFSMSAYMLQLTIATECKETLSQSEKIQYNKLADSLYNDLQEALDIFGTAPLIPANITCDKATHDINERYITQYESIIEKINKSPLKQDLLTYLENEISNTKIQLSERLIKTINILLANATRQIEKILQDMNNSQEDFSYALVPDSRIIVLLNQISRCIETNLTNNQYIKSLLNTDRDNKFVKILNKKANALINIFEPFLTSEKISSLKSYKDISALAATIIKELKPYSIAKDINNISDSKDIATIRNVCNSITNSLQEQRTQEIINFNDIDLSLEKIKKSLPKEVSEKLLEAVATTKLEIAAIQIEKNNQFIENISNSNLINKENLPDSQPAGIVIPYITLVNNQLPKYFHLPYIQEQVKERVNDIVEVLNQTNELLLTNLGLKNPNTVELLQNRPDEIRPLLILVSKLAKDFIISTISKTISPLTTIYKTEKTTFEKVKINGKFEFRKLTTDISNDDKNLANELATQLTGKLGELILTLRETKLLSAKDAADYIRRIDTLKEQKANKKQISNK